MTVKPVSEILILRMAEGRVFALSTDLGSGVSLTPDRH